MENLFKKRHKDLTDGVVEGLVPQGGIFRIARDQDSLTQEPGGVNVVHVERRDSSVNVIVPNTDSLPQTEGADVIIWKRKR